VHNAGTLAVLEAVGARLIAGTWLSEVVELPHAATAEQVSGALRSLSEDPHVSLMLAIGSLSAPRALSAAMERLSVKTIPGLSSIMRAAALPHQPASALLGDWGASTLHGALLLTLPPHAGAAISSLDAVLPAVPHAVSQASDGKRPAPQLKR